MRAIDQEGLDYETMRWITETYMQWPAWRRWAWRRFSR